MEQWHQTGCVLCAQNCGLSVLISDNKIKKVRADQNNPRSQGYICRKGLNVAYYQHHDQRLTHPLKRVGDNFEQISWDQAVAEIAEKMRAVVDQHGPKSLAYIGGGGQSSHMEAGFGVRLLRGLGSHYHYNALGQELTGHFWAQGRVFGRQNLGMMIDHTNTEMLVGMGWNGMHSHQMPQAPRKIKQLSRDADKLLVIIDPRRSETAKMANIHLSLKPGTDALLLRAMIAIILKENWHKEEYLAKHASDFERIKPWFTDFDVKNALEVCQLDFQEVHDLCRLFSIKKWSLHPDMGVMMNRHSTATSYLIMILLTVCGRIGQPGGNVFPGAVVPISSHSDERKSHTWRTVATDYPAIAGYFPPNVVPEEILSDRADRLRAIFVSSSNPLRSYADTTQYEKAFKKLDLLVTIELAMTETAVLSDYVLPARSGYESWDTTFFSWTYPEVYCQLRRPLIEPQGEPLENGEIMTRIADALGLVPEIPASLYEAAGKDRLSFGAELMKFAQSQPKVLGVMPFILAKTLGSELKSAHLAALWGLFQTAPKKFQQNAARAGFKEGSGLGEEIYQKALDHPEGFWIGRVDVENNLAAIRTDDGRINLFIPEMEEWIKSIQPQAEKEALRLDGSFPLILAAGSHMNAVANTLMRNPAWNKKRRACTLVMNPKDAESLKLKDEQKVKITTEAGQETCELEISEKVRIGQVLLPHGFGLKYNDRIYGANVNRLTKNTHRDRLAGTPYHRYTPCRVEAI